LFSPEGNHVKLKRIAAICILVIVLASAVSYIWLISLRPSQDALVLKSYGSLSAAVQGLVNGEVSLLPIDRFAPQELKPIQQNTRLKLISIPSYDFTYIGMNLRNWPLNDSNFRMAMLYAFDRQKVLNGALGGLGEVLQPSLFSSAYSISGWTRFTADAYSYDRTKAAVILDRLGIRESTDSQFRIDPSTRLPMGTMFIISRLSEPTEVAAATLFAKDMQAVGLPVVSLPMTDPDFNQYLRIYAFDMFVDSSTNNLAPKWLYTLFDSGNDIAPVPLGTNLVGYHNRLFDEYAEKLMSVSDQTQAQYAAERCQEILASDLPVLPIFSKNILVAADSEIKVDTVVGSLEQTIRNTAASAMLNSLFQRPLRIGLAYVFQSLDPTTTSNPADWIALHLTTEQLVTYDQGGNPTASLAEWTEGYRTLTLRVGSNAKFYTGKSITANDVVATLNWLRRNAKPSSKVYPIIREVHDVFLVNRSALRISLALPDNFAVYDLTDIFALPANRLESDLSATPDFLMSQAFVSSGPFLLREFTQADGVYMQLNGPYFGQAAQNTVHVDAYEGADIFGARIFPGSEAQISSSALTIAGQPVRNASSEACVYDHDGMPLLCTAGTYKGQGVYSAEWQVDSRFHSGEYNVESTLSWSSPSGKSVLYSRGVLTVRPLWVLMIPVFLAIVASIAVLLERQRILRILGLGKRRRVPRRARRRRKAPSRRGRTREDRTR
jgi:ABC-type transport system substrate-binding protein